MIKSFFNNAKWRTWAYAGVLLIVSMIYVEVELNVWLSEWFKEFYDILQKPEDITLFWAALKTFSLIAGMLIIIGVLGHFFARHYTLVWRQAITEYYLPHWQKMDADVEGSSQRIQEDTAKFARLVEELGEQVINSVLTLIAFTPILWALSDNISIPFLQFKGSLVLLALGMSIGGLVISWFIGIKLPGLEYNNQKAEAAFRKELVYGEDDRSKVNIPSLMELFTGVKLNYHKLFLHYTYFDLWKHLYYQFNIILPYLIMGPSLFTNLVTLGVVVQTGKVFGEVHRAASVLLDRWTQVTELRSVIKRLKEFEDKIDDS